MYFWYFFFIPPLGDGGNVFDDGDSVVFLPFNFDRFVNFDMFDWVLSEIKRFKCISFTLYGKYILKS